MGQVAKVISKPSSALPIQPEHPLSPKIE